MKRHALFVGVDNYADQHIQDLHCAVNDATELAGFFKHRARFDRAEALANPPNCEMVIKCISDMVRDLGTGDEFIFFFAGHGVKVHDEVRFVCAEDRLDAVNHAWTGIPQKRLEYESKGAFNRLFLLDTCRADIHATNRGVASGMEKGMRDLMLDTACLATEKSGSLTIVCSCDDGQCAGEVLQLRHGLFSKAMLELLDEEGQKGGGVSIDDDLVYNQLPAKMRQLAKGANIVLNQAPQKEGPPIVILNGMEPASTRKASVPKVDNFLRHSQSQTSDSSLEKIDANPSSTTPREPKPLREYVISNWTVAVNVDMPGCGEKQLAFTLFETLSRYLCLLQGLGKHGEGDAATAFGNEPFRDSAWRLVSGYDESAAVKCPVLTNEDKRAIANAGGMEELARQGGAWPIFKELEVELDVLEEDLKGNCKSNPSARNALALAKELSKSLKI